MRNQRKEQSVTSANKLKSKKNSVETSKENALQSERNGAAEVAAAPKKVTRASCRKLLKEYGALRNASVPKDQYKLFDADFKKDGELGWVLVTVNEDGDKFWCNRKPISAPDVAALYFYIHTMRDMGIVLSQRALMFSLIADGFQPAAKAEKKCGAR